eukprot:Sspe_Gene.98034::Locus_71500_Transcript_1_1_Confidence_1.000_Length_835::g.98034::m.98034
MQKGPAAVASGRRPDRSSMTQHHPSDPPAPKIPGHTSRPGSRVTFEEPQTSPSHTGPPHASPQPSVLSRPPRATSPVKTLPSKNPSPAPLSPRTVGRWKRWKVVGSNGAIVRAGVELESPEVEVLPYGCMVQVVKVVGNRALIESPVRGWVSIRRSNGGALLLEPVTSRAFSGGDSVTELGSERDKVGGRESTYLSDASEDYSHTKHADEDDELPGGFTVGDRVWAAKDIIVRGQVAVREGTEGIVRGS